MTVEYLRVGAVVLTHNSSEDLPACLTGLLEQRGIDLQVIIVDNASHPNDRAAMEADFLSAVPEGRVLNASEATAVEVAHLSAVFLRNEENAGYSAGNNIGARLAAALGCEAVLIVNPDVRISDPNYVAALAKLVVADPKRAVACSAVRNLLGAQENPMIEPGFGEEMLWPARMLTAGLFRRTKPATILPKVTCPVEKVSGACFMIRTDFLQQVGYFDQSVFLYCEESILMAQVRAAGWYMLMDPNIEVLHAHRSIAKGDPLPRFRAWAESRRYFHETYSGHSRARRGALALSRRVTLGIIWTCNLARGLKG